MPRFAISMTGFSDDGPLVEPWGMNTEKEAGRVLLGWLLAWLLACMRAGVDRSNRRTASVSDQPFTQRPNAPSHARRDTRRSHGAICDQAQHCHASQQGVVYRDHRESIQKTCTDIL